MSDPKEALERLKTLLTAIDHSPHWQWERDRGIGDDLRTFIAKQEGLEREVERLTCRLTNAETMAGIYFGQREAAEAQLSALQEAARSAVDSCCLVDSGACGGEVLSVHPDSIEALRALLPAKEDDHG